MSLISDCAVRHLVRLADVLILGVGWFRVLVGPCPLTRTSFIYVEIVDSWHQPPKDDTHTGTHRLQ